MTWRTPRSTILQSFTAVRPPTPEISVTKILRTKKQRNKETKKQVRQLSGLAYIPTCRSPSPQMVYNTGRHRASGGIFLTRSATVGQVCRSTGLTSVERVIDFSIFDLGGLPLGPRSPKGRRPGGVRDLAACKVSSLYANPRPRYPLPKFLRTNRKTNKKTNSNRHIHNMPIGMCG